MASSLGEALQTLFFACINLDREALKEKLDRECAGDLLLRRRVEELVAAHSVTEPLIDKGLGILGPSLYGEDYDEGDLIGKYIVLRRIGSGGMGAVYLAARPELNAPPVAIKIVKKGMDTEEILRRFEIERDILSALENKATIVNFKDAGVAASGVPFFVMEYVDGLPIDEYCRERHLGLDEVLRLFLAVCAGVADAQQKIVAHRDLKPGNILITREGGQPKLLDFGIAAMLSDRSIAADSIVREFGMMSPEYASPEQIDKQPPDSRMDVYSMGVVLYRLLTGAHPQRVDGLDVDKMLERIKNEKPIPPSEARGGRDLMPANGELRKDLDNILLKALHEDAERRYRSIEKFSADIENYLAARPVDARPDEFAYKARKFVNRNRAWVLLSAAALVLLMAATGAITWQVQVANAQRVKSAELRGELGDLTNWLVADFHAVIEKLSGATEARRLLATRALQSLNSLAKQTEGDAAIQTRTAKAYQVLGDVLGLPDDANLGDREGAIDSYRKALELLSKSEDNGNADLPFERAVVHERLGRTLVMTEQEKEGYQHETTALNLLEQLVNSGRRDHATRRELAFCNLLIGKHHERQGETNAALAQYEKAVSEFTSLSQDHVNEAEAQRDLSVVFSSIGDVKQKAGEMQEAQEFFERSMRIRERAAARLPHDREAGRDLSTIYDRLAALCADTNQMQQAVVYETKALAIDMRLYEIDQNNADAERDVADDYVSLGDMLSQLGQARQALADDLTAFEMRQKLHAKTPNDTDITAEYGDSALFVGTAKAVLGDATADEELKIGREIGEQLHKSEPAKGLYLDFYAKAFLMSGQAMEKLKQKSAALEYYERGSALFHELKDAQKNNFEADAHLKIADEGVARLSKETAPAAR